MFQDNHEQTLDLLNDQQIKQIIHTAKMQTNQGEKLKKWVIYWKKRGKSRACNQQDHEQQHEQDYSKDLEQVGRFSSLNQFFGYFTSIKEPSAIEKDIKLFYFLSDCKPLWEEWLNSGCLLITIKFKDQEKDQLGARILNSTWQFLLFGLIGNNLPRPREIKEQQQYEEDGKQLIVGLIFQRRQKICLIQVWYRYELHANKLTRFLQEDIQMHLKLSKQQKNAINMKYKRHKDSIQTNSTLKGGLNFKMMNLGSPSMPN